VSDRQTTNDPNGFLPLGASDFSASPRRGAGSSRTDALHVCPSCDSQLVYPVDWAPAARKGWSVELRCPDCEWSGSGVYAQEIVDAFDEALDLGTEQLLADLSLLARANMEEQVESFVTALHAGWILPEDF
jgi:hypothetical protein